MAYKVRCPSCGKSMRLPEGDAGMPVVCLACGSKYVAPKVDGAPEASVPKEQRPLLALLDHSLSAEPANLEPRPLPPLEPLPNRYPLIWAAAAGVLVLILGIVGFVVYRAGSHRAQVRDLQAMLDEAQHMASRRDFAGAHEKYRDIDRKVQKIGTDDPEIKKIADQARKEQEFAYSMLLSSLPASRPTGPSGPTTGVAADGNSGAPAPPPPGAATEPAPGDEGVVAAAVQADINAKTQPSTRPVAVAGTTDPNGLPIPQSPTASGVTTKAAAPAPPPPPPAPPPASRPQRVVRRPPLKPLPEHVEGVTDERIGKAILRGANHLMKAFNPATGQLRREFDANNPDAYFAGLDSLAVYALLQCGMALPGEERLNVRGPLMTSMIEGMKRLPANEGPVTYARAIRATALGLYNRKEDRSALRADVTYLLLTHREGAYTYAGERSGGMVKPASVGGDNSNSQYGLLGVWSGAEAGIDVPADYWSAVQEHWAKCQGSNGMWNYGFYPTNSGTVSMTAAGTASLFVAEDYRFASRFGNRLGRDPFSPQLTKALDWWSQQESFRSLPMSHWGYTLYGIERVGLASGFKYFGRHDWYREMAQGAVERQREDGGWGDMVDTSYALLFLARGRHPILMNKLRFEKGGATGEIPGYWGNRPRDVANLARYAGRQLERPLNWQVVTLDVDWWDWMDSPILSIASHRAPYFTDEDYEKFRQFTDAGGMLFLQADGDSQEFDAFAKTMARRLFPKYPLSDLPANHPLNSVLYKVEPPIELKVVDNGVRLLMAYSPKDITKYWQIRDDKQHENEFRFGTNLFVYAAGKRELRNRLSSPYVSTPAQTPPNGVVALARLKYEGNWDPEPGAWRRFANWMARTTGTGVGVDEISISKLAPNVAPIAHLTGTASFKLTSEELKALRGYVDAGGVLLVDACGGSPAFAESASAAINAAFPERPAQVMSREHLLFDPGAPGMDDLRKPRLRRYSLERGVQSDTRPRILRSGRGGAVIISDQDLTAGLLGTETWGISGYEPSYAEDLMKNLIFWTLDGKPE